MGRGRGRDRPEPGGSARGRVTDGAAVGRCCPSRVHGKGGQFPTPAHLVSWAKLVPRTIQSGPRNRSGRTGKVNPYLNGVLGEVASAAAKTDTFLSQRYHRLVRRRGRQRALVAISRSILVVVWHSSATQTLASSTSARTSTKSASTRSAAPATSSGNSWPSATRSPSPRQPSVGTSPRARLPAPHPGPARQHRCRTTA
ncbi:MAG: transposase [Acidimicrobiales bacterium]